MLSPVEAPDSEGRLLIVVSRTMALVPGLAVTGSLRAMRAGRAFRGIAVVFRLIAIGGASAHEGRALPPQARGGSRSVSRA
jgi:hypothetical protein